MTILKMISDNLKSVRLRIRASCERCGARPEGVQLVCVSKEASVSEISKAVDSGIAILGESRVQDALPKYQAIGGRVAWHMIGHLQTNKARDAVRIFSLIHSVDSVRLAKEIDKEASKIDKIQQILIQVNASGEKSKFGVEPSGLFDLLKEVALYPNIDIAGLMTIAPEVSDPETVRPYFRALRELRDKINGLRVTRREIRTLSMGMTDDFEVAIEEGSNMVRIGRAIFGT